MFKSPDGEKQVLKSYKTSIFREICSKIAPFCSKTGQKPPGTHWDPQDDKIYFSEWSGYEYSMLGGRIFELSPVGKKLP